MVSAKELQSRIKDFFNFSWQEISGLIAAVLLTGFIFSFRDWGDTSFDFIVGLYHLFAVFVIAGLSFAFRISCQKIFALSQGYKAEFKVWWVGLVIMIVVGFLSVGFLPLILVGGVVTSFMVKQRLGEFRYGFSYIDNAVISFWGVIGNMIAAIIFAVGLFAFPQSYFFSKGLILNLMMGFCALLPLPQLDGLKIFFGSRVLYFLAIGTVLLASVLLLTRSKLGLIMAIVIGSIAGIVYVLKGSEK
jgi:hypothetical protein